MTPGLAFFYGGMVRAKHVLGMLMQNFFAMGLVSVLWAFVGFSLAFGDGGKWIGNFDFAGLKDLQHAATQLPGYEGDYVLVIPAILFCAYQMMFAVITPALITGATADRLKFGSWAVLLGVWSIVVIGKRRGYPHEPMPPHNLPWTLLGTGILWFGWFGFNAGSALSSGGALAAQALLNTHLAAAAAMLGWLVVERVRDGHATTLGGASGAVAGLVAITPCAGFVSGLSAMAIGFLAGSICLLA